MKTKFSIFLIIILLVQIKFSLAQTNLDSLKNTADTTKNLRIKIDAINALAFELRFSENEDAINYLKKSFSLLENLDYQEGKAKALNNYACVVMLIGNFDEAKDSLEKSLEIYSRLKNDEEAGKVIVNIGINYYYQGMIEKAIEYCEKSLLYFNSNPKLKASVNNNLGVFNRTVGNYEKAIKAYHDAVEYFKSVNEYRLVAVNYNNIGNLFTYHRQYDKAIQYHNDAMAIALENNLQEELGLSYSGLGLAWEYLNDDKEANKYYTKAVEIFRKIKHDRYFTISSFGLANTLFGLGDINGSFALYDSVKNKFAAINDIKGLSACYASLGLIYVKKEEYDSARVNLETALKYQDYIEDPHLLKDLLINLAKVYEIQGDNKKALQLHHIYDNVKDSLYDIEAALQVAEMEAKYRLKEKNKQIEETEKKLENSQETNTRLSQNIKKYWYLILLLIIISVSLYYFYLKKSKLNKALSKQKDDILNKYQTLEEAYSNILCNLEEIKEMHEQENDNNKAEKKPLPSWIKDLSSREIEVLSCLAVGMTDKEIEEKLFISVTTVRTHCRRIYSKLLVKNRSEAANLAREYGII